MTTQSKITLWSVLIALLVILVTGWATHRVMSSALQQSSIQKLTLIRDIKAENIEDYFSNRAQTLAQLGRNARIVSALQDFKSAYAKINRGEEVTPDDMSSILRQNYDRKILPNLKQRLAGSNMNADIFWPRRKAAQYLHYQYVVPTDSPSLFPTDYDLAHAQHHEALKRLSYDIGARDLLLIDVPTGNIIYTVVKKPDLGVNILTGPYRTDAMVRLFEYLSVGAGQVGVSDLVAYLPDDNVNSLFVGTPVTDTDNEISGVLMIRLSSEELTELISGELAWQNLGLGETGEVYLAGEDYFMRSNSRFAEQNITAYVDKLRARGVEDSMIRQIDRQDSTVLAQEVRTDDVTAAYNGDVSKTARGVLQTRDYRGEKVISAYTLLDIPNLKWALIVKQDMSEIMGADPEIIRRTLLMACLVLLAVWFLSYCFARWFITSRPAGKHNYDRQKLLKSTSRVLDAIDDEEIS